MIDRLDVAGGVANLNSESIEPIALTFHIVYANDYVSNPNSFLFRLYNVIKVFVNQYLQIHCD